MSNFTRELIHRTVADLVYDFLVYDRKQDNVLPEGSIEQAIYNDVISIDDIVVSFRNQLESMV